MRLLRCNGTDTPTFTEDFVRDDDVPSYAILSHTWQDGEEVTYGEFGEIGESNSSTNRNKAGYDKIRFCAQQAQCDGLEYFWIDTCCINKADQVELRNALSSMFRWYQNAAKCYVFMSDVSAAKRKIDSELLEVSWMPAFRASRWFTRGWTLQELLAPRSVEFFSKEGKKLGDKASLTQHIREKTRIPDLALQGAPLSQFSVDERLSWFEHRVFKIPEDRAYSLVDILGVYVTPIYGEGVDGAFKRLMTEVDKLTKCLSDLRFTDPRDDKKRIEDTKGGLLKDSYCWVLSNPSFQQWQSDPESQLLWIKGDPGKGKTMLLCGIINELQKSMTNTTLVSYFFCQAADSRINTAAAVLRGLLYLLISQQPSLVSHVRKKHDHAGKALFEDTNTLFALMEIFIGVLQDPNLNTTYLIIDALDECVTDLPKLLDFIVQHSTASSRVKWIVSSRNWPDIEERLERAGHKVRLSLELNAESVSTAVSIFIEQKVSQLAQQKKYDEQTRIAVLEYLTLNANATFLWVALVLQDLMVTSRLNVQRKLKSFPPGLDSLYDRMIQQICTSDVAELCIRILSTVALVYRPITLEEMAAIVDQLKDTSEDLDLLQEIVGLCGSFLTVRENVVYFVHQSAKDFLLTKASNKVFPAPAEKAGIHYTIFSRSLQVMSSTLRRDMYDLRNPGYPADEVKQPDRDPLSASRYSCLYWIDHLCDAAPDPSSSYTVSANYGGPIGEFLRSQYLYWLEALSLCKSMSKGVVSMAKLDTLVQRSAKADGLSELVQDARRFIMYHKGGVENSPLQVYASALLFSPTGSLIRNLYKEEEPKWITVKPDNTDKWSACLQTLEGHSSDVYSVAFSHDSTWLASASFDSTVKIWDASSGECLHTLKGHNGSVNSVVFSHDSTRLASGSGDRIIKIWDARSGECLQTLEDLRTFGGKSYAIMSVAFSHDSKYLASASSDFMVKIWDASRGKLLRTLQGHSGWVRSVVFSHDSARLASASSDNTVKIWDPNGGWCLHTLQAHSSSVNSVAFSHDSKHLASSSSDCVVKIWDTSSGNCLRVFQGHNDWVRSVAFSHDSTLLASASVDNIIKIWDVSSCDCLETLQGHSGSVYSVAFSHDSTRLASASFDMTVKIWDLSAGEGSHTLEDHFTRISLITFSQNSRRMASVSWDSTIKIWDVSSGKCLHTLPSIHTLEDIYMLEEEETDWIWTMAFSHDLVYLASVTSGLESDIIKIWDVSSGTCLRKLEDYRFGFNSVSFSHDSTMLASSGKNINIWDMSNGDLMRTIHGQRADSFKSLAFSHDSARLASVSLGSAVKIWDASSGECLYVLKDQKPLENLHTFEEDSDRIHSVAFSHDSACLATASFDGTVQIWDGSTGGCLQTFVADRKPGKISFDADGSHIYTRNGSIIFNALPTYSTADATGPPRPQYQGGGISSDGAWITYNKVKVLWLPSEYRPSCSMVSGQSIGIGVGSGQVYMYTFNIDKR